MKLSSSSLPCDLVKPPHQLRGSVSSPTHGGEEPPPHTCGAARTSKHLNGSSCKSPGLAGADLLVSLFLSPQLNKNNTGLFGEDEALVAASCWNPSVSDWGPEDTGPVSFTLTFTRRRATG